MKKSMMRAGLGGSESNQLAAYEDEERKVQIAGKMHA